MTEFSILSLKLWVSCRILGAFLSNWLKSIIFKPSRGLGFQSARKIELFDYFESNATYLKYVPKWCGKDDMKYCAILVGVVVANAVGSILL